MRCLRSIGEGQQTGYVYLSEENKSILEDELNQNFRISIAQMESAGQDKEIVEVRVIKKEKIKLQRVRRQFTIKEKKITAGINLELQQAIEPANLAQYTITHTQQEGLDFNSRRELTEDITQIRQKRKFSKITLVAEVSRYLNKECLFIEDILSTTLEGTEKILEVVNQYNELLYDWIIPRLFKELYEIEEYEKKEQYEVELIKLSSNGYYQVTAAQDKIVRNTDENVQSYQDKSFHLDTYCFDSQPEKILFWKLLEEKRIKKVYFTGMLTHGQSDFYIQYIDPDSHSIRSYYPDFLFQKEDGTYVIVEVKGDNLINDPIVQAKQEFASQMAVASGMTYKIIKGSEAGKGMYTELLG